MAFAVILQYNRSERNKMDKDVTNVATCNGDMMDESSVMNPKILIDVTNTSMRRANYCYIATWLRYYYITDVVSYRNNLYLFSLHCDVLMSFKDQIRECYGITQKQENRWNLYLNDGSLKVYQNPMVLTKKFPSGFSGNSFVLSVAGS